jgi:hypothetical protein
MKHTMPNILIISGERKRRENKLIRSITRYLIFFRCSNVQKKYETQQKRITIEQNSQLKHNRSKKRTHEWHKRLETHQRFPPETSVRDNTRYKLPLLLYFWVKITTYLISKNTFLNVFMSEIHLKL